MLKLFIFLSILFLSSWGEVSTSFANDTTSFKIITYNTYLLPFAIHDKKFRAQEIANLVYRWLYQEGYDAVVLTENFILKDLMSNFANNHITVDEAPYDKTTPADIYVTPAPHEEGFQLATNGGVRILTKGPKPPFYWNNGTFQITKRIPYNISEKFAQKGWAELGLNKDGLNTYLIGVHTHSTYESKINARLVRASQFMDIAEAKNALQLKMRRKEIPEGEIIIAGDFNIINATYDEVSQQEVPTEEFLWVQETLNLPDPQYPVIKDILEPAFSKRAGRRYASPAPLEIESNVCPYATYDIRDNTWAWKGAPPQMIDYVLPVKSDALFNFSNKIIKPRSLSGEDLSDHFAVELNVEYFL